MSKSEELYTKIVEISEEFLGPAGERFVRRQIQTHLSIQPHAVKTDHLPELVDWIRLTFTMITNDTSVVNSFADRLLQLTTNSQTKSRSGSR